MSVKRFFGVLGYVALGLAVTLLLVELKDLVERWQIGHEAELGAYRFLQGRLGQFDSEMPVVVADISEIPGKDSDRVTPRDELQKIVQALVNKNARAIALDIDFSPNESGLRDPVHDKAFFDYCLSVGRDSHVPVFLGVYKAEPADPDTWLGLEKYAGMAVSLDVPEDTSRLPISVQAQTVNKPLPSLGAALANAYNALSQGPPGWLRDELDMSEHDRPGVQRYTTPNSAFTYELVPINYSKLDQIIEGKREIRNDAGVADSGSKFDGKMVIVGDGTLALDQFHVNGRLKPVAGVFIHAAAAYTLAREPLYEFKKPFRVKLDLFISLWIILLVARVRLRDPQGEKNHAWSKRQWWYICAAVVLVFLGGIALVTMFHVLWSDFLLVLFALLLHPSVEKLAHRLLTRLWRGPSSGAGAKSEA